MHVSAQDKAQNTEKARQSRHALLMQTNTAAVTPASLMLSPEHGVETVENSTTKGPHQLESPTPRPSARKYFHDVDKLRPSFPVPAAASPTPASLLKNEAHAHLSQERLSRPRRGWRNCPRLTSERPVLANFVPRACSTRPIASVSAYTVHGELNASFTGAARTTPPLATDTNSSGLHPGMLAVEP